VEVLIRATDDEPNTVRRRLWLYGAIGLAFVLIVGLLFVSGASRDDLAFLNGLHPHRVLSRVDKTPGRYWLVFSSGKGPQVRALLKENLSRRGYRYESFKGHPNTTHEEYLAQLGGGFVGCDTATEMSYQVSDSIVVPPNGALVTVQRPSIWQMVAGWLHL
jgi:hypothetical protein